MQNHRIIIFIILLLVLTPAINSNANGLVALPDVIVYEWMTGPNTGQYGISIDSPDGYDWYVEWFAVENPDAEGAWTSRAGWVGILMDQTDFTNYLQDNSPGNIFPVPLVYPSTDVALYFSLGNNIGPDDYDDSFYWTSEPPGSHFWAGLTPYSDVTGFLFGMVHGEAANPIPEPATMLLLGTGLAGVAGAARRRKKNQA